MCIHLLQALWRWEWNSDHKIDKRDRPTLFQLFKALLYAKCDEEYDDAQKLLFENEITKKYPQFMNHSNKNILPRKEEWAISERIRKKLCTHYVDTTNYVEVSFRITKDINSTVLRRILWPICLTLSLITQFIMYSDALTSAIIEYRN